MFCTFSGFLFIFTVPHIIAIGPEGYDPSCQSHHTQGYGYRLFFDLPLSSFLKNGGLQFNFSLSGSSDGHVLLSEKPNTYPGYEIVLGAGGNEFSEIRKYVSNKLEVKTNQITKQILSPEEIRNFSVFIIEGNLKVFSNNNETYKLILVWKDPAPLDVRYVSFCAWTGVTVSWYYDCKGVKAVLSGISPLQKLKKTILKGYDAYSIPVQHLGTLVINTSIGIDHVGLDVRKSQLTTHGRFNFSWHDFRIKWNPKDFNNISNINLFHREIWLPEFILLNSVDDGSSPMGKAVIRISHTGDISWWPDAKMLTWCSLDLNKWPFDRHSCTIKLGLIPYPETVQISFIRGILQDLAFKNSQWDIKSVTGETKTIVSPWEFNRSLDKIDSHQTVVLDIVVQRQSMIYVYSYFVPVIGSVILVFTSFSLPVFCNKRLLLHSTCFFLLLFNIMSLDIALPALTTSTPHIMRVSCSLLLLSTIHVIFTAFIVAFSRLNQSAPPKYVTKIVNNRFIQSLFCLFGDYHAMEEENFAPEDLKTESIQMSHFVLFGIMLDRVIFGFSIIYICIVLIL